MKRNKTFATVSEAVRTVGMDLSYNHSLALDRIAEIDKPSKRSLTSAPINVWTTEDGKVFYSVKTFDGLHIAHEFYPFSSMMHDGDLMLAEWRDGTLVDIGAFPNTKAARKVLASVFKLNPALVIRPS